MYGVTYIQSVREAIKFVASEINVAELQVKLSCIG